jgi:hypothetical protein
VKSKRREVEDVVALRKQRAARKLEGLDAAGRQSVLREAVEAAEKEIGYKFPRFKGRMARPKPLRKAQ